MSDFERNVRDGKNLHKLPFWCGVSKIKKLYYLTRPNTSFGKTRVQVRTRVGLEATF